MSTPAQFMVLAGGRFVPTDIPTLAVWYDLSDPATMYTDAGTTRVAADGDLIYQVTDKTGTGNTGLQTTQANRPAYKVGLVAGRAAAQFNGTAAFLATGTQVAMNVPGATMLIVARRTGVTANNYFASLAGDVLQLSTLTSAASAGSVGNVGYSVNNSSAGLTLNQWYVLTNRTDRSQATGETKLYVDGVIGTTQASDSNNTNNIIAQTLTLGRIAASTFTPCDIVEVLLYQTALSAADHNTVGRYLASKYGTTPWTTVP